MKKNNLPEFPHIELIKILFLETSNDIKIQINDNDIDTMNITDLTIKLDNILKNTDPQIELIIMPHIYKFHMPLSDFFNHLMQCRIHKNLNSEYFHNISPYNNLYEKYKPIINKTINDRLEIEIHQENLRQNTKCIEISKETFDMLEYYKKDGMTYDQIIKLFKKEAFQKRTPSICYDDYGKYFYPQ